MNTTLFQAMAQCIIDGDADQAGDLAQQAIELGIDPLEAINQGFVVGVNHVGEEFSCGNAFLPELVMAGEAMKTAVSTLEPEMARRGTERQVYGKVVIGTIEGDISTRRITVGEGAIVQGAITAETVRVYGAVSGEIKASNVHLAKSARVDGDIGHQSIAMEAGASVNGRLTRLDKSPAVQRPSSSTKAQETTAGNGSSGAGATTSSSSATSPYGSGYRA